MTFCMLQNDLGKNILLSSKKCSPDSIRLGSSSTPANNALAPTNLNIWVIMSLMTVLCSYQRKLRPFKPSHFQRLTKNCVGSSVWSTSIVKCVKMLRSSCPINCFNLQKRQIRLERRAPKVFWCYQTCDRKWSIFGLTVLQYSVSNTYWRFQAIYWCSHLQKGQAHCFLFVKDEYCPTKLHHNWEITPLLSCISQGVPQYYIRKPDNGLYLS